MPRKSRAAMRVRNARAHRVFDQSTVIESPVIFRRVVSRGCLRDNPPSLTGGHQVVTRPRDPDADALPKVFAVNGQFFSWLYQSRPGTEFSGARLAEAPTLRRSDETG